MLEIRLEVDGDAVEGDPAPDANADGGDLVLAAAASRDPDADPAVSPFAPDVEAGKRLDHPFLQVVDEAADIRIAALQVEHDVGHALSWAMIGVLAATARPDYGEIGRAHVCTPGTNAH